MNASSNAERQILVIEDEQDLASLLVLHLSELPARMEVANDGETGLALALSSDWDVIVLDLRLPKMGGLDVCREVRAHKPAVPILMLTARSSELDRVLGLELGADDYPTKPFSILELQARIKALLRHAAHGARAAAAEGELEQIATGELRVDQLQRRVWLAGEEITLTPREFDLLWHFASHPGRVFTRAELLSTVWGYGHDGYDHTVNSHINRLRAKLGDERTDATYIHTVWGVGYRFEAMP